MAIFSFSTMLALMELQLQIVVVVLQRLCKGSSHDVYRNVLRDEEVTVCWL